MATPMPTVTRAQAEQPPIPPPAPRAPTSRGAAARLNMVLLYTALTLFALIAIFPFWWMIVASTRRSDTILNIPPPLLPGGALVQNYNDLMQGLPFWRSLLNSLFVSGVETVLVLFLSSLAGFAFAKYEFPGRDKLFALMLATMMVPGILGVVPLFIVMKNLGWLDTYLPLIVPGAVTAFGIFWMRQYIQAAVPTDLLDAARIDGAHEFRIYWNVVIPVISPALGALAIMTFMGKWNEFFWPLIILKDPSKFTLPVALASLQSVYGQQLGVQMLGATIAILPVLIVYLLSARRFMAGLTAGAIKGM